MPMSVESCPANLSTNSVYTLTTQACSLCKGCERHMPIERENCHGKVHSSESIHITRKQTCVLTASNILPLTYSMTHANMQKSVLSSYNFPVITTMMLLERLFLLLFIFIFEGTPSRQHVWSFGMILLAGVSLGNTVVAVTSLSGLNVPMYNTLKRCVCSVRMFTFRVLDKRVRVVCASCALENV